MNSSTAQIASNTIQPGVTGNALPVADFNQEQLVAIETTGRHTLVVAGAGTGKTRTIIGRASYLLQNGVPGEELLIITLTGRAASEIRSRINTASQQAEGIFAGTFHSWAMQLIRRNPQVFQLDSPTLLDRDDALTVFRKFRRSQSATGGPKAASMADFHSLMINTRLDPADAARIANVNRELVPVFVAASQYYTEYKRQHGYIDYDDILEHLAVGLQDESLAQVGVAICRARRRGLFSGWTAKWAGAAGPAETGKPRKW